MKAFTLLLTLTSLLLILTACSPPDPAQDNFLKSQLEAIDKAKNVEKIGFDHKKQIDNIEQQAK